MNKFDLINAFVVWSLAILLIGIFYVISKPPPDAILDSMLCEKYVPTGTTLVTDRVIKCTNGKRYMVVE